MAYALAMARMFFRHSVFRKRSLMALAIVGVNVIVAVVARSESESMAGPFEELINDGVFGFLLPFAALMYGVATIRDDLEGGTLWYLLLRPIPRRSFYLGRLAAAWAVVATLGIVCVYLHAILLGTSLGSVPVAVLLGSAVYVAFFGLLAAVFDKPFIIGLVLTFAELFLSSIPIAGAYASIRANVVNIGDLKAPNVLREGLEQLMDMSVAPMTSYTILFVLLGVFLTIGTLAFERREFVGGTQVER